MLVVLVGSVDGCVNKSATQNGIGIEFWCTTQRQCYDLVRNFVATFGVLL